MSFDEIAFKEKLEATHSFPGSYTFKFIVKKEKVEEVKFLLKEAEVSLKPSSGNKYVSVTLVSNVNSSDEVVTTYKEAKKIEGLISL